MQFIDLHAQYQQLKARIDTRIHSVLDHGKYIMGPEVFEFEERLAEYIGVKHVISCGNGTDALQLSLMAMGIGPGDAVITTPFTFFATAEVIALVGAEPVFSDINEKTYNLCPLKLEETIKNFQSDEGITLKAVIAVDLFGLPANYSAIERICKRYGLTLIEDAAQGMGGKINDTNAGSFGDIATTSFFPAKPLGCYGDGGAVLTDDDDIADVIKSLRVHGKGIDKYDNVRIGMNSRLDTLQAAILLEKLVVFDDEIECRNNVANQYAAALCGVSIPFVPDDYRSSWAQYTVMSSNENERKGFMSNLRDAGIPSAIYYGTPLHQQTAFNKEPEFRGNVDLGALNISENISKRVFSLPMHPYLSETEIHKIVENLK